MGRDEYRVKGTVGCPGTPGAGFSWKTRKRYAAFLRFVLLFRGLRAPEMHPRQLPRFYCARFLIACFIARVCQAFDTHLLQVLHTNKLFSSSRLTISFASAYHRRFWSHHLFMCMQKLVGRTEAICTLNHLAYTVKYSIKYAKYTLYIFNIRYYRITFAQFRKVKIVPSEYSVKIHVFHKRDNTMHSTIPRLNLKVARNSSLSRVTFTKRDSIFQLILNQYNGLCSTVEFIFNFLHNYINRYKSKRRERQ